jgi:hypothetical protein
MNRVLRVIANPQRLKAAAMRRIKRPPKLGITSPHTYSSYIPDRYSVLLPKYLEMVGDDGSVSLSKFVTNPHHAGDLARYYFFRLVFDQLRKENIIGDVAELGVYQGHTAYLIAEHARKIGHTAYLFDTFTGYAKRDLYNLDSDKVTAFQFDNTSFDEVKHFVGEVSVKFIKGYFPETASQIPETKFSLVHIDCDLGEPFRAALEFFYPRLMVGGFLIMHDYSSLHWPGAERAIDEFFAARPEKLILVPDKSGTAAIRKV